MMKTDGRLRAQIIDAYSAEIRFQRKDFSYYTSATTTTRKRSSKWEFAPDIRAVDLVNLPNYHIYVKLMIDGVVSRGCSGDTVEYPD